MRIISTALLLLIFIFIPETRADEKVTEEGTFLRREANDDNEDGNENESKTEDKIPNLIIERLSEPKDLSTLPKDSVASKVAASRYSIKWSPLWTYDRIGGVRLSAAAMSSDKSLIAIAETTGPSDGPFGSVIVFMETGEWSFVRYIRFKDEKINSMFFLPGSARLICRFARQIELKKPYRLAVINPRNGKYLSETKLPICEISDMIANKQGSKLFVKPSDSTDVLVFETEDLSREPLRIDSEIDDEKSSLALAPDNSVLLICGNGKIKIFDMEFKCLKKESVELPDGAKSGKLFFTGTGKDLLVLIPGKDAYLFRDNMFRHIMDMPGKNAFTFSKDDKRFVMIDGEKNTSLNIFTLPEFEFSTSILTSKMRPYTAGNIITCGFLERSGYFFILDDLGNFIELRNPKNGKRWKKDLIFKAAK